MPFFSKCSPSQSHLVANLKETLCKSESESSTPDPNGVESPMVQGSPCPFLSSDLKKKIEAYVNIKLPSKTGEENLFSAGCIAALVEVMIIYGFDSSKISLKMFNQVIDQLRVVDDHPFKYFKWFLASYYSYSMKQAQPDCKWNFKPINSVFGNVGYKFCRWVHRGPLSDSFSLSILMSKKAMPLPRGSCINQAVKEHVVLVTTKKVCTNLTLLSEIKRTMSEVLNSSNLSLQDLTRCSVPSSNACYGSSGEKGGLFGRFKNFSDCVSCIGVTQSISQVKVDHYDSGFGVNTDTEGRSANAIVPEYTYHSENRAFWNLFSLAEIEERSVEPMGLSESLKIRVITKGPGLKYHILRPLQRFLLKALQNFPCFKLTGQPISEVNINNMFRMLHDEHTFISGDYRDCTNEMYLEATVAAIESLEDYLDSKLGFSFTAYKKMIRESLVDHRYWVNGEWVDQQNGQLMGSILSFPVLCVINAALVRYSSELSMIETRPGPKPVNRFVIHLSKLRAFINGDDFVIPDDTGCFYEIWRREGNSIGLMESVGKTYNSGSFLSMNSRFFRRDSIGRWKNIPFAHLGLCNGRPRSVNTSTCNSDTGSSIFELAPLHTELLSLCHPSHRQMLSRYFIYRQFDNMKGFRGSWSNPHWCGGLGIGRSDRQDRALAKSIIKLNPNGLSVVNDRSSVFTESSSELLGQIEIWSGPTFGGDPVLLEGQCGSKLQVAVAHNLALLGWVSEFESTRSFERTRKLFERQTQLASKLPFCGRYKEYELRTQTYHCSEIYTETN